jgi:EAL domain-containing protein (putative c-di-GMP-specific phosphodiesterase class I)
VDLRTGDVAGYELLSRFGWPFAVGDLAATPPPDRWFAAAAQLGLAAELTVMVLQRALAIAAAAPPGAFCSVNVGPDELVDPRVQDTLNTDLSGIVVELTEHAGVEPSRVLADALSALRSRGAVIAVDDVGSGHAGLTQLLAVRPEIVKLDRGLTSGVAEDPGRRDLIDAVRQLTVRLGARMIAEGVETYAECEALVRLGVDLGQGWFLGMPAQPWPEALADVRQWIRAVGDRVRAGGSVAPLVQPFGDGAFIAAGPEVWVVRDGRGDPASMVWRTRGGDLRTAEATRVPDATPVRLALETAIDRPEPERWAPLAAVDHGGRLLGWLDVGDLVRAVAGLDRLPGGRSAARRRGELPRQRSS